MSKMQSKGFIQDVIALLSKSFHEEIVPFEALRKSVIVTLEKNASTKTRFNRANQVPDMNKKLSKEIMKRYCLRNKYLNTISDLDKKAYNQQRNCCQFVKKRNKGILWQS